MNTQVECPDVITLAAGTNSGVVKAAEVYDDATLITLYGPVAAEASTIEVTDDIEAAVPVWFTLQEGGADVSGPAPGKAKSFAPVGKALRIHYTVGVGAQRVYKMTKTVNLT